MIIVSNIVNASTGIYKSSSMKSFDWHSFPLQYLMRKINTSIHIDIQNAWPTGPSIWSRSGMGADLVFNGEMESVGGFSNISEFPAVTMDGVIFFIPAWRGSGVSVKRLRGAAAGVGRCMEFRISCLEIWMFCKPLISRRISILGCGCFDFRSANGKYFVPEFDLNR